MEPVVMGASDPRMSSIVGMSKMPSLPPLFASSLCWPKGPLLNMSPGRLKLKPLGLPPTFGMLMPSCFNRSPVARNLSCVKGH